jgi:ribosomal protein S18 acetylase RimI-like enzyme
MAIQDLAFHPVDIRDSETTKAFIALLESFLPFSCGFIGLTQSHLTPQPDPYLKVWVTFDFSNYHSTPEVPELFTVAIFTPIQGRLFCSADASPEDVTPEELIHREKVARLYAITATSLVRTLPGHEKDSEYLLGVVHEKFAPLVKPYAGGAPIAPCRLFFYPPSNTEVISTATTGPDASRWLVTDLEESDLELVRSTSHVQRTIEYLRIRIPVSTCIRDSDSADGRRPVAWLVKQSDGSFGTLYVDPDYRGKRLGELVVTECIKRLRESSGDKGLASQWYFVEVFQENPLGTGFFSRLKGWEAGWETWWARLDVTKYSGACA